MGLFCCFGSADKNAEAPRPAKAPRTTQVPSVERTWVKDESWTTYINETANSEKSPDKAMPQRVRQYIDTLYPDCAQAGSIEDMGEKRYPLRDGTCSPLTYNDILILDNDFTGVVYSVAVIVNLPPDADLTPGKWLDSREMEEAKVHVPNMLTMIESQNVNAKHTVARIFIGADSVWCRFHPENRDMSVSGVPSGSEEEFKQKNDELAKALRKDKMVPQGIFRASAFERTLQTLYMTHPGCTVWDEGPLQFSVGGKPHTEPTRMLVARVFNAGQDRHFVPEDEIDATVYQVSSGLRPDTEAKYKLLQNRNPQKHHGNIVELSVFIATPLTETWPKYGTYKKSAVMRQAGVTAIMRLDSWNRQQKFERCYLSVYMGADHVRMKVVSDRFGFTTESNDKVLEDSMPVPTDQNLPSLEPFFVTVKKEDEHELFDSEVQFQAIKNLISQRANQDPERYRAMAPMIAVRTTAHFIDSNYPGCETIDKGEFPIVIDDKSVVLSDTRLVVAKDPTKGENNNIVAAFHLVPQPGGHALFSAEARGKSWLETPEMKVAEEALRQVLVKWYKEDRLADDCMAQVVMGMDVSFYRFVDGERFEDYPDERIQQIRWQ